MNLANRLTTLKLTREMFEEDSLEALIAVADHLLVIDDIDGVRELYREVRDLGGSPKVLGMIRLFGEDMKAGR